MKNTKITINTLGRDITSTFFASPTGYDDLEKMWSERMAAKTPTDSSLFLLYAILRGKDYRKAFSPVTNPIKLANGQGPHDSLARSMHYIICHRHFGAHLKTAFGHLLSPDALEKIGEMVLVKDFEAAYQVVENA